MEPEGAEQSQLILVAWMAGKANSSIISLTQEAEYIDQRIKHLWFYKIPSGQVTWEPKFYWDI